MPVVRTSSTDESLTIVIVHFNTPDVTLDCIRSLLSVLDAGRFPSGFRVVVVDNCSETVKFEALKAGVDQMTAPEVFLMRSCINTGFGLGCMLGLNYSAGRYIAFVNSDTRFDEDCFTPLIDHLERHPAVGVIGPQHLSSDGHPDRSFGYEEQLLSRLTGYRRKRSPETPSVPVEVDFIFGAFMLFRREAFAASGGFDPTIFLFYEEMDICHRLRVAGYLTVFFPGASFRHLGQASFKAIGDTKPESDLSLLYIMRKNRGYLGYRLLRFSKLASYFLRAPLRSRYRKLFSRLITMGPPQALSLRVQQKCNFDFSNRP